MTKLEQVARAMWEARRAHIKASDSYGIDLEEWGDGTVPRLNGIDEEARAAVESLREPNSHQYDSLSATGMLWRDMNSEFVWRTYIDAILNEKPE